MRVSSRLVGFLGPMLLGVTLFTGRAQAQNEDPVRWKDQAELSFLLTSGNASSNTFGFKNILERFWGVSSFKFSLGGIRTESGKTVRTASGTPDNYTVSETTDVEVTAENYFVKARYDRRLSEAAFLHAGVGWDRNTFAGIQNRYDFVGGAGRTWFEEENRHLKSDVGLTYTLQDEVGNAPDGEDSFLGVRASIDFLRDLTETTGFASVLVVDENLDSTDDFRSDWANSLTVAMSERFALKASYQILFDNKPALTGVPLGDEEVFVPLDKVDSVFTVAIVANF
jgi:putative salt-induced outer membrane protein YdiY